MLHHTLVRRARRHGWQTSIAATAAIALTVTVTPAAFADDGTIPNAAESVDTVREIVPEVVEETTPEGHTSIDTEDVTPSVTVDSLSDVDGQSPGIEFNIDYGTDVVGEADGITMLDTTHDLVEALVQPTSFGVRVLTTIQGPGAPDSYEYTFDVPAGTVLTESDEVFYLDSGDDVLGSLQLPWAVDADGDSVPTTYTWEGSTLTQHVDLSAEGIDYPVVADPAWGYTYSYNVSKSASANKKLLKNCFNCYFPVSGAPKKFPSKGQLLPLKVAGLNFECKFKSEFSGTNYFGFQFDATKNHVDGKGSNIIFEFRTVGGKKKLVVSAYIANDSVWIKNNVYRAGAALNWANFASNLNKA